MKIKTTREQILNPLQDVSGVVERRQTLPVLGNILIVTAKDHIELTATDLEIEITSRCEAQILEEGKTTIPARKLFDICKALSPGSNISLTIKGSKVLLTSGRSRFTLAILPADDFPLVDKVAADTHLSLTQIELKQLIERTSFSMAQQDVRYYLNGLLFEFTDDLLRAVATDGHRLATSLLPVPLKIPGKQQVIMPKKGIQEILRILNNSDELIKMDIGSNHLRLSTELFSFSSKLIDGRFPDYERVIPKGGDKVIHADREALKQVLIRTSILSNEKYRGVRLSLDKGLLTVQSHNPEQEQAEEQLEVNYDGQSLEIGFNVTYWLDILAHIKTEQVEIILSDENSSCLLQEPDNDQNTYVVMPMRL
ncbi:MAG: DNA polymerase III subunit beta [Gammaproteobacteria bacterium]